MTAITGGPRNSQPIKAALTKPVTRLRDHHSVPGRYRRIAVDATPSIHLQDVIIPFLKADIPFSYIL